MPPKNYVFSIDFDGFAVLVLSWLHYTTDKNTCQHSKQHFCNKEIFPLLFTFGNRSSHRPHLPPPHCTALPILSRSFALCCLVLPPVDKILAGHFLPVVTPFDAVKLKCSRFDSGLIAECYKDVIEMLYAWLENAFLFSPYPHPTLFFYYIIYCN